MLRKNEGRRRRGQQRIRWLDSITNSVDMNVSKFWEIVKDRKAWRAAVHRGQKESDTTEQLNNKSVKEYWRCFGNKPKILNLCSLYSKMEFGKP